MKTWTTWMRTILALAIVVGLAAWAVADDDEGEDKGEKTVTMDQVPAPARDAILKAAEGAEIKEIEEETEGGKVKYSAEFGAEGVKGEVEVDAEGKVLELEKKAILTFDSLPAPVKEAVKGFVTKPETVKVKKANGKAGAAYVVESEDEGADFEGCYTEAGDLIRQETSVDFASLPAGLQTMLKEKYPKAEFKDVDLVEKYYYDIEVTVDGKKHDVTVDAAGKKIKDKHDDADDDDDDKGKDKDDDEDDDEDEVVVPIDQIPAAAREAILNAAGPEIQKVDVETIDGATVYSTDYKKDGKKSEIHVDADGKAVKDDDDHKGKDKDDDKDDD